MAIAILVDTLKPIGVFFPLTSQATRQAPNPTAKEVAPLGVTSDNIYAVYHTAIRDGVFWMLLKSATKNKNEWARADVPGTPAVLGEYVAL